MSQSGDIHIGGSVDQSVIITGSGNVVRVGFMERAAAQARAAQQAPERMLRILAVLAAPVIDPARPDQPPAYLDLRDEWHRLKRAVQESRAPILLARLAPPTLDALRSELSPREVQQGTYPQVLHFSGHAWRDGLVLEDVCHQTHYVTTAELLKELDLPQPLELIVLNGCESAASAQSAAQGLVKAGLARAVIGHERPVYDDQAIAFARTLYRELSDGRDLKTAFDRARRRITTHEVQLFGDATLRLGPLAGAEPIIDDARPPGRLERRSGLFLGRGRQLRAIACKLEESGRRATVIVITGLPGIGKTSLALEAAHRNAWRFSGGAAYAQGPRQGDGGSARALLAAAADALGLANAGDDVMRAVIAHTQAQPTLLVLDNLENLPGPELRELARFLNRLGEGSAAILTLRPPQPVLEDLPRAWSLPLHRGLDRADAIRYALTVADDKNLPLTRDQAEAIAAAVEGHPMLIEKIVALARRRPLSRLLQDVREKQGDFLAQLDEVLTWSADLVRDLAGDTGLRAWGVLPLFPAGWAAEGPLLAAMHEEGAEGERALKALRKAALIDFDVALQGWCWHATVSEYAGKHGLLDGAARERALARALPAWREWLTHLDPDRTAQALEEALPNLEAMLAFCQRADGDAARAFLTTLANRLPHPERTLGLREFTARVYALQVALACDPEDRARALNAFGIALSALGRRQEALAAADEAAGLYRKLAEANPDAFPPDLANSLDTLGEILLGMDECSVAVGHLTEAIRLLTPVFLKYSAAFSDWMSEFVKHYETACQCAGCEPDADLLAPILPLLEGNE